MRSVKAKFVRRDWSPIVARDLSIAIIICTLSSQIIANSARAADTRYPTHAIMSSFIATCEELSDERTIRAAVTDLGWREVSRDSPSRVGIMLDEILQVRRDTMAKLESSGSVIPLHFAKAFEHTINGEDLSLVVFGVSDGDGENVSCIIYDFDEIRKPSAKELERAAGQKATTFESDSGLSRWKWVPAFIRGHQGAQVQYVEPGSSASQLFPDSGLQIRAVRNVYGTQSDEVKK